MRLILFLCLVVVGGVGCGAITNSSKQHISLGAHRAWRSHEGVGDGITLNTGWGFFGDARSEVSYAHTRYAEENIHRVTVGLYSVNDDDFLHWSLLFEYGGHLSESGDWGAGVLLGAGLTHGMKRKNPGFIIMPTLYTWIGQYDYEWELRTEGAVKLECCWFF